MTPDEWRQIVDMHAEGISVSGIAAQLQMSRNTVRRALSMDAPPNDHRPRVGSSADALVPAITALLAESPEMTVADIHRQLQWSGSRNTLAKTVRRLRGANEPLSVHRTRDLSAHVELPRFSTDFIGRHDDLSRIRDLLGRHRLVTVAGAGGIGKTRLTVEAAAGFRRAFADGVRFVELAPLRSEALLAQSVLDALGLGDFDDSSMSVESTLIEVLRDKHMLIVLDNCEHLVDACARLVTSILRNSTRVQIVVTSRENLLLPEEFVHVLEPLSIGGEGTEDWHGTAVELFESRAAAAVGGFSITESSLDAVRGICSRLDGVPLAIELACARLTALSIVDLADRLDDRMSLFTVGHRGGPDRHRSLHATVAWSFDLCTPAEQVLWERLSIFAEGFDLDTAEQVCAGDSVRREHVVELMSGLVSKSVVRRDTTQYGIRFRMLETIRRFGFDRLSDTSLSALRRSHLVAYSGVVGRAHRSWAGAEQERASERLRADRANLRSALQFALDTADSQHLTVASQLVSTWFLWSSAFSVREHRMWVTAFLDSDPGAGNEARLSATLGLLQTMQGERDDAVHTLDLAETLARADNDDATVAFVLQTRGLNTYLGGDYDRGGRSLTRALEIYDRLSANTDLMWTAHIEIGMLLSSHGDTQAAHEHFEFVRAGTQSSGEKWMQSYAIYGLGLVALVDGEHRDARDLALASLALKRSFDDTVGTTLVTDLLAWSEAAIGSGQRAAVLLGAASSMWDSFGMQLYGSRHWVQRRESYESRARSALGADEYTRAHDHGANMSTAELISYALRESERSPRPTPARDPTMLSRREEDIARLVALGLTNREIATRMVLSVRTIDGHVSNILRKLDLTRRRQVADVLTTR